MLGLLVAAVGGLDRGRRGVVAVLSCIVVGGLLRVLLLVRSLLLELRLL